MIPKSKFSKLLAIQLSLLVFSFLPAFAADPLPGVPSATEAATSSGDAELKQITAHLISQLTNDVVTPAKTPTAAPVASPAPPPESIPTQKPAAATTPVKIPSNTPAVVSEPTIPVKTTNTPAILDDKHKLAIGDKLSYRILEDEDDVKPLIVSDLGDIEFPYIGRVPAENKTCKQLAADIKAGLEKEYYYEATVVVAVDLLAKTRGRVYLVGALRSPGPQEILTDETLTLSKAILRCGGFSDFASKKNVKITRKTGPAETDKQTFVVNVGQIYDNGKIENDIPLEPGDMILVTERKIRF